jgi:hypothetical protein
MSPIITPTVPITATPNRISITLEGAAYPILDSIHTNKNLLC